MARGATLSEQSGGENISHFTGVRLRVTGVGNLKMKMSTLDDIRSVTMADLPLKTTNENLPTRLCNLTTHRACLECSTTQMDEYFKINRIIIYSREVATSLPG